MLRFAITLGFATATLLTASADPLLAKLKALSSDGSFYSYEMAFDDGEVAATGKVDPSAPIGERITVYTPAKAEWPEGFAEELADMDRETDGDIWCHQIAEMVPETAERISETETEATFAFTPVGGEDKQEKQMLAKMKAQATLDKSDGALLSYSMSLPKPFKPMMFVKISDMNMRVQCDRAPDGRTYAKDFSINVNGSAFMNTIAQDERRQITKLLEPVEMPPAAG